MPALEGDYYAYFTLYTRVGSLTYMAELSEGVMTFVDPRFTSQLCSGCGSIASKTLADRVHVCSHCELVLDRDVNEARVILRRGIGMVRAESTPVGEGGLHPARRCWASRLDESGSSPL